MRTAPTIAPTIEHLDSATRLRTLQRYLDLDAIREQRNIVHTHRTRLVRYIKVHQNLTRQQTMSTPTKSNLNPFPSSRGRGHTTPNRRPLATQPSFIPRRAADPPRSVSQSMLRNIDTATLTGNTMNTSNGLAIFNLVCTSDLNKRLWIWAYITC